jgi:lipid-A-disaccharide synthase
VKQFNFLMVTGESSGDMYGADVARALFQKFPGCTIFGLGGQRMREAGVKMVGDIRDTAVMGPMGAFIRLPLFYKLFHRLADRIEEDPPTAAILIDFSGFNLPLARRIRAAGTPVIYYVSPQVWASRAGRIQKIKELVNKMLVIFPFEKEIYEKAGVDVEFVGHPLIDTVRATKTKDEFCHTHNLDPKKPILALLPGSRKKEIRYILPTLCEVAKRIRDSKPDTQFVLPAAPNLDRQLIDEIIQHHSIKVIVNDTYNAIRYARAAIVASGTATLETALLGTPEVIVYRISPVEAWFLKKFVLRVRIFGIVNIILGEEVVPELFQDKFTPELVTQAAVRLMEDVWLQSKIRGNYEMLRRKLGGGKVPEHVADAVARVISSGRSQTTK